MLSHPSSHPESPSRTPLRAVSQGGWVRAVRRAAPLAVVASVLLAGLDSPSGGTHPDERLYLSLTHEMEVQGTWMTPTLEGLPDFTKPPLLYWAARACSAVFGPRLWAARLPVAVCALLLALVAGRLARRFGGEAAFARGVLLVGTCLGVLRYGRLTMMDVPLALALAVAVDLGWTAVETRRPEYLLGVGAAAGLSALLKGPVGPLLVLGIVAGILAVRAPSLLRTRWGAAGAGLSLVVGGPWFVAMAIRHGRGFVDRFFLVENVGKFTGWPWTLGGEAWLLLSLPLLSLPWVALVRWRPIGPELRLVAGVWIGVTLLIFSLPGLKQMHYVVPCLVPLLLLAAVPPAPHPVGSRATAALFAGLTAAALIGLRIPFPMAMRLGLLGAAVLLALGAGALWQLRPEAAAVGFGGAAVLTLVLVLPGLNPLPVPDEAWRDAGGRTVAVWRQEPGLFELLAHRPVHRVNTAAETAAAAARGAAVVIPVPDYESLPAPIRGGLRPLLRWTRLRSRIGLAEVVDVLRHADLARVQESMLLVVAIPPAGGP